MRRLRYRYPFFQPPHRPAGPYLPISFVNPFTGQSVRWNCLVDTGADSCLLPRAIADSTGHRLKGKSVKSSVTMGVEGGAVTTWKHTFVLQLLDPTNSTRILWESKKTLIDCVEHNEMPPLLGQADFLKHFMLTVDYRKQVTTLEWPAASR